MVLAQKVDHHIDVLDRVLEALLGVVDQFRRSEPAEPCVPALPGGPHHPGPQVPCELDGEVPDATGGGVHQNPLPGGHVRGVHQDLPGRQRRQRHGGRLLMAQGGRLAGELAGRSRDVLGVATGLSGEPRHAVHLVSGGQRGHPESDFLDHTGDIPAQGERRLAEHTRHTAALTGLPVDRVDTGGAHPHQHLGGQRLRPLDLRDAQHLRAAERVLYHRTHHGPGHVCLLNSSFSSRPLSGRARTLSAGAWLPTRDTATFWVVPASGRSLHEHAMSHRPARPS